MGSGPPHFLPYGVILNFNMNRNIILAAVGAILFWGPDIIAKTLFGVDVNCLLVAILCPSIFISGFVILKHILNTERWLSVTLLLGLWFSAAPAIGLGIWVMDPPPPHIVPWTLLMLFVSTIFPPFALILSAYDGTMLSLIFVTSVLGVEMIFLRARKAG